MKHLAILTLSLTCLTGCSVSYPLSSKEPAVVKKVEKHIEANKQLTPEQKAQLAKEAKEVERIRKIKCQDARLDLLQAEADKDIGRINQINQRLQKQCLAK
jgi:hypothetical protein